MVTGTVDEIKKHIDTETLTKAQNLGLDIEDTIRNVQKKHGKYSVTTQARRAQSTLYRRIQAEDADTLKGILAGYRDRPGENFKGIRASLISSTGHHAEISVWGRRIDSPNGETLLPHGHTATIRATYNEQYDSYQAKYLEDTAELDTDQYIERLLKVAETPDTITTQDEYSIKVITGTISSVRPQQIFIDGEPSGEGGVWIKNQKDTEMPHCSIQLRREDGTSVRVNLERQRFGEIHTPWPDFVTMCQEAKELHDEPSMQAQWMTDGLRGADIVAVGNVMRAEKDRDNDGNPVTYVNLSATSIAPVDTVAVDADADADERTEKSVLDELKSDIEAYAAAIGESVNNLSISDVENIATNHDDAPMSVKKEALRQLQTDAESTDSETSTVPETGSCPWSDCDYEGRYLQIHIESVHENQLPGDN